MSKSPKHPRKGHVDRAAQELIGRQLRAMYSQLLREPLPEALLTTLRSLEQPADGLTRPEEKLLRAA
jgi:hypothetical protein